MDFNAITEDGLFDKIDGMLLLYDGGGSRF